MWKKFWAKFWSGFKAKRTKIKSISLQEFYRNFKENAIYWLRCIQSIPLLPWIAIRCREMLGLGDTGGSIGEIIPCIYYTYPLNCLELINDSIIFVQNLRSQTDSINIFLKTANLNSISKFYADDPENFFSTFTNHYKLTRIPDTRIN